MSKKVIALFHPGAMGSAVGRCLAAKGERVLWASEGRSAATRRRAEAAGLEDSITLNQAIESADVILSVCPPHGALELAKKVGARKFNGIYVDGNAVSPDTAREIGRQVESGGARFVDGGIIGPPPMAGANTRLYLSGDASQTAAAIFAGSDLQTVVLPGGAGAASALKMCYAAWSKGSVALFTAIRALSTREGVDEALVNEWNLSIPGVAAQSESIVDKVNKAWRWVGEMEEIAATFAAADLPDGFHMSAAEIYRRLEEFKDSPKPSFEEIMASVNSAVNA